MKKAIVTGANGFVGSAVVQQLLHLGYAVFAIDLPGNSSRLRGCGDVNFIGLDVANIRKLPQLLEDRVFDSFFHFAWVGSAGPQRADVSLQMRNVETTAACVEVAAEMGCAKFIGAGSIMELEAQRAVFANGNKPGIGYVYGTAKLAAHCISKAVATEKGISHLWGMITNAYGVGELSPRFINTTIRKIHNNEPLEFSAATQNYDFVYITDAARAFCLLGEKGRPFCQYTIGSGAPRPLKEYIFKLEETLGSKQKPSFGKVPFTGVNLSVEDFAITNLVKDTDYRPLVPFEKGVGETASWIMGLGKKNES